MPIHSNAAFTALLAAALFGATTPLAKLLLGTMSPFMVVGLFYFGSGIGLAVTIAVRRTRQNADARKNVSRIRWADVPWLFGAIATAAARVRPC